MSKERFEVDCTGGILDLKDTENMYCLNDSEICELLNKQDQKIADLEAKLAESEERINWLVEAEFNRKWAKKYVEMRRKEDPMLCLPDSDEVYEHYFIQQDEIKRLTKMLEDYEHDLDEAHKLDDIYAEKLRQRHKDYEQLKISFAVEKINKIKNDLYENDKINIRVCDFDEIDKTFDNQIKQLKEMK